MSRPTPRSTTYRHQVRYFEADQQGVVFNMWYLAYFEDAMFAFFEEGGLPYLELRGAGYDLQLVHSEVDWRSSLRWPGGAEVTVSLASVGRTSFALRFEVAASGQAVASARAVYVVVAADGSGKVPIPKRISDALGPPPAE